MVELLDNEIMNTAFTILGLGWVKTKIHSQSLMPGMKIMNPIKRRKDESMKMILVILIT